MMYTLTCKDKANLTFVYHKWSLKSESDIVDYISEKYGWEVLSLNSDPLYRFIYNKLFGKVNSATSVPIEALISFYRQFAMMQENHVNLNISLDLCQKSAENAKMAAICEAIRNDIHNGKPLAESMAGFPYVFDRMSSAMINAGIKTNDLAATLNGLADSSELSYEMDKKLNSASIYPMITLTIAMIVLGIFSYFVIPKFMPLYNSIPGGVPLVTRILVSISEFMTSKPWVLCLLILLPVLLFRKKREIARSVFMQNLFHKLPGISTLTKNIYMCRYLRMLGQLSEARLPVLQEIRILEEASEVKRYRELWGEIGDELENGLSLSESLAKHDDLLPPMVIGNIRAAEKSGDVAKAAKFLAGFYTREAKIGIANIQVLIEPLFVVIIASFVGFLLFGMFLPLFDVAKLAQ